MGTLVKIYLTKEEYLAKLAEINVILGFPSYKYSKFINGVRIHFVSDEIMTRTWANEEPFLTKDDECIFPISEEIKDEFTGLVKIEDIELKVTEPIKIISK